MKFPMFAWRSDIYHVFVTKQTTTPPLPPPFMARSDISRVAASKTSTVTRNATRNSDIRVVPSSSLARSRQTRHKFR